MPDIVTALRAAINDWDRNMKEESMQTQQTQPTQTTQQPKPPYRTPQGHPPRFAVTNNASRLTFEFVRDNPGLTTAEIAARMVERGFKEGSVTSLLSQMVRVRMIRKDENKCLYTNISEYVPINPNKITRKPKPKAKPQSTHALKLEVQKAAAPVAKTVDKPVEQAQGLTKPLFDINPKMTQEEFANEILNKVSIFGARVLYDRLRTVFEK
jgi:histone acetyltransferase (RNA polymerase elongator complex component)